MLATLMAITASVYALPSHAQMPADKSHKYRTSAFTVMGASFGRISSHIKGEASLDPASLITHAQTVDLMSRLVFDGFLEKTEQAGAANTPNRSKPEIWKEWDKFRKMQGDLQMATAKLSDVARANDMKALQAAFGEVGKTCKACHDAYRMP